MTKRTRRTFSPEFKLAAQLAKSDCPFKFKSDCPFKFCLFIYEQQPHTRVRIPGRTEVKFAYQTLFILTLGSLQGWQSQKEPP